MDKTITVNSLVQKGIVPQDVAGHLMNAPECVLEELDKLPKQNAAVVPNRPVAEEKDVAEGLALLKAKREADVAVKANAIAELKANKRCAFTPEQLEAMDTDGLKALSATLGKPITQFGPAAGGGTPAKDEPKVNNAAVGGAPMMPTYEDVKDQI